MSHFSRIKTNITDLKILQKSLTDINLEYSMNKLHLQDSNGNLEYMDMVVRKNNTNIIGFLWNGQEYTFISDFDLWKNNYDICQENIVEKILQQYAINSIIEVSHAEGFTTRNQEKLQDGSIKLVVQRWN
uniref:hypothetical protein n=1 Tax=Gracilaria cervicornis TaxID=172960 RepID=UPI001D12926F|nr:hypothetical protein LK223_pgp199 [Gracilaria cervicornis]UAD83871.1 hypothetical protein [Gracilaria cervicornis]